MHRRIWPFLPLVLGCNDLLSYDEITPRDAPLPGCTSTAECTAQNGGVASICPRVGAACVPVLSEDCDQIVGDYADPEAIHLGVLVPRSTLPDDIFQRDGEAAVCAMDVARREIEAAGGLPSTSHGSSRSLSLVACGESFDGVRAIHHLNDLGVDAVIGPYISNFAAEFSNDGTVPHGMVLVGQGGSLVELALLEDHGLTWNLFPNATSSLVGLRGFLEVLESRYRAAHPGVEKIRVAILRFPKAISPQSEADYLLGADVLRFNGGRTAAENLSDTDPDACPAGCLAIFEDEPDEDMPSAVAAFDPHIVLHVGHELFWPEVAAGLDASGLDAVHVMMGSPSVVPGWLRGEHAHLPPAPADISDRLYSVIWDYRLRYNETYAERLEAQCPMSSPDLGAYDALYLVALAYLSKNNHFISTADMTGTLLAGGLAALSPDGHVGVATPISFGTEGIMAATNVLLDNGEIDVSGATGALDFDNDIGSPHAPGVELACIAGSTLEWASSGVAWDRDTHAAVGTFACPE
jgi:branched-chain amino acid transport system substrate-binding protein